MIPCEQRSHVSLKFLGLILHVADQPLKTTENLGLLQADQVFWTTPNHGSCECPGSAAGIVMGVLGTAVSSTVLPLRGSKEISVNPRLQRLHFA